MTGSPSVLQHSQWNRCKLALFGPIESIGELNTLHTNPTNYAPSRASISLKRRLKVDCRMFNASAACLKLRCCDAMIAHFRSRNSTDICRLGHKPQS